MGEAQVLADCLLADGDQQRDDDRRQRRRALAQQLRVGLAEARELAEAVVGEQRLGDADGEEQRQQAAAGRHARRHAPAPRRRRRAGGASPGASRSARRRRWRAMRSSSSVRTRTARSMSGPSREPITWSACWAMLSATIVAADAVGVVARVQRLLCAVPSSRSGAGGVPSVIARSRWAGDRSARRSPGSPAGAAARRARAPAVRGGAASCVAVVLRLELARRVLWVHRSSLIAASQLRRRLAVRRAGLLARRRPDLDELVGAPRALVDAVGQPTQPDGLQHVDAVGAAEQLAELRAEAARWSRPPPGGGRA